MSEEQATFIPNPKLYREMSQPFESVDAANAALQAFQEDVAALRAKHRIAECYVIFGSSVQQPDDEPSEFLGPGRTLTRITPAEARSGGHAVASTGCPGRTA